MPNCTLYRIIVSPAVYSLAKGNRVLLNAVGYDKENNAQHGTAFTWASSDSNIASIAADGTVTAVKAGVVTITATSGSSTGQASINVAR